VDKSSTLRRKWLLDVGRGGFDVADGPVGGVTTHREQRGQTTEGHRQRAIPRNLTGQFGLGRVRQHRGIGRNPPPGDGPWSESRMNPLSLLK